jgi:preprotein translocase subunit SecG
LFGASGAGNVLTKATTTCAVLFMFSSLVLIKMYAGAGAERAAPTDPLKGSVMERSVTESAEGPAKTEAEKSAPAAAAAPASGAPAPAAPVEGSAGNGK